MNIFANAWNQPRTSAAGLLIAISTIAQTLSQQGVNLGKAGSGTVITLIAAVATAILGLLARDPAPASPTPSSSSLESKTTNATVRMGAWALIALLIPLPGLSGCSAVSAAQNIVNWTPALQSAVATVDSAAGLLAPQDAPIFAAATLGFDTASNLLVHQANAYLANPSASVLAQIQTQVVTFQQQVNAAVLQAARISDSASQKHALAALQGVATIVSALLAAVQSISTKTAIAQMAAASTIKLATVRPYLNLDLSAEIVAHQYDEPRALARFQVSEAQRTQTQAGF